MTASETYARLDEFLDGVFRGQERLSRDDLRRHAIAADLPAQPMALLDRLPEGEYAQDEAAEALRQVPELIADGDGG
jgi:hypothetical protein